MLILIIVEYILQGFFKEEGYAFMLLPFSIGYWLWLRYKYPEIRIFAAVVFWIPQIFFLRAYLNFWDFTSFLHSWYIR
jgi:hypothetical protein